MRRMTDTVRYGIIGTGMMGCEHIRNLALIDGAEVTAIADRHPTSRDWGRNFAGDAVEVYEDHRDLLARAPVDAVVIATPNFTHHDVLRDVFRTRKHVLVEKPLCTTVEDCHRAIEAAALHPGVVWVGMEYRYMRAVDHLIARVRDGDIGALRMLAIREHRFPFLPKVDDWNRFNRNTGGTLVEKCCHFFDLMNLIARQRPARVYASGAQDVNHLDESYDGETPDILDNAFAVVDYDGGARALLDLCMFAENSPNEVEIAATGDAGKIEAFVPAHEVVFSRRHGGGQERRTFELEPRIRCAGAHHGSTYYEHLEFLDAVRRGGPPAVSAADGALAVAVGAAAEQSIRERRPVELRELGF
jgi:predicted dehydrogenase